MGLGQFNHQFVSVVRRGANSALALVEYARSVVQHSVQALAVMQDVIWRSSKRFIRRYRRRTAVAIGRVPRKAALLWIKWQLIAVNLVQRARLRFGAHWPRLRFVAFLAVLPLGVWLAPGLQAVLEPRFTPEQFTALRSILVGVGGSIIGATAIVFSVVMLAVQVNFARIPFGLFRKLSTDLVLLSCFAATFMLGATISMTSIVPDISWLSVAIVVSLWCALASLSLFLFAYDRALKLISPSEQLQMVVASARRSIRRWSRLADRASKLSGTNPRTSGKRDMARAAFFKANPHWEGGTRESVSHALSFARRYAEQGEYPVSSTALVAVIDINAAYIKARGKTFFPTNPFFSNPLSSESFISDSLEQIRRLAATAESRADEEQVIQIMAALVRLCELYAMIDYGSEYGNDVHHAQLACGYLVRIAESLPKSFGPDVLMEGARFLGQAALVLVRNEHATGSISIAQSIAKLALVGVSKPGFEPVASTAVQQLANLAFELLCSPEHDTGFSSREIRASIHLFAQLVLATPEGGMLKKHNAYLKPYYSQTDYGTFLEKLTNLVNALSARPDNDADAERVLDHLVEWSDGMYKDEKSLLLAAVDKRSFLAFELVSWTCQTARILAVAGTAPSASDHVREQLSRNSAWLVSVLDWFPGDKETVAFVENLNVTEQVFGIALEMHVRELDAVAEAARDVLLQWAFKAGSHENGWATLESALLASAVLAAWKVDSGWSEWLVAQVTERVTGLQLNAERRVRVIKRLTTESSRTTNTGIVRGEIEQAMRRVDKARLKSNVDAIVGIFDSNVGPTEHSSSE